MRKILVDTNAYVALLAGDQQILAALSGAEQVGMSVFVLGELYGGFKGGSREKENRGRLASFLNRPTVTILEAGDETARIFGDIKHQLKTAGTPLPINDVWVAAHALEHGLVLVTYDRHFAKVQGLRLWEDWDESV